MKLLHCTSDIPIKKMRLYIFGVLFLCGVCWAQPPLAVINCGQARAISRGCCDQPNSFNYSSPIIDALLADAYNQIATLTAANAALQAQLDNELAEDAAYEANIASLTTTLGVVQSSLEGCTANGLLLSNLLQNCSTNLQTAASNIANVTIALGQAHNESNVYNNLALQLQEQLTFTRQQYNNSIDAFNALTNTSNACATALVTAESSFSQCFNSYTAINGSYVTCLAQNGNLTETVTNLSGNLTNCQATVGYENTVIETLTLANNDITVLLHIAENNYVICEELLGNTTVSNTTYIGQITYLL
jgi:hypothetical protein